MTDHQKLRYRDRILTELYNSKVIHAKVEGICKRNFIPKESYIHEDVLNETFLHLSKRPVDEIIELYEDDKKRNDGQRRLVGLAVRIAVMTGVMPHAKNKEYPKHSLARFILFTSNFQQQTYLCTTEYYDTVDKGLGNYQVRSLPILVDEDTEENDYRLMWETIRENLTKEENEDLEFFLDNKKKQGRYKREIKDKWIHLLERIESIIKDHKINIEMTQETIFKNIESLLPVLKQFQTTGSATITQDQKLLLKTTYEKMNPGVRVDVSCSTCIQNYLNIMQAYYEREKPKFMESKQPVESKLDQLMDTYTTDGAETTTNTVETIEGSVGPGQVKKRTRKKK